MMIQKNKVYMIGGAKGVGKSTILNKLSKNNDFPIVHAGSFFKGNYQKPIEEARTDMMNYVSNISSVILDSHYTHKEEKFYNKRYLNFTRGLNVEELFRFNELSDLEFTLIDIPIEVLLERRKKDLSRIRDLDLYSIEKELNYERLVFEDYCDQINKKGLVIQNFSVDDSIEKINNNYNLKL